MGEGNSKVKPTPNPSQEGNQKSKGKIFIKFSNSEFCSRSFAVCTPRLRQERSDLVHEVHERSELRPACGRSDSDLWELSAFSILHLTHSQFSPVVIQPDLI